MSKIFLIIPALKADTSGDQSQIKSKVSITQEEFVALIKDVKNLCLLAVGEYDANNKSVELFCAKAVIRHLQKELEKIPRKDKKHQIELLIKFFDNFCDIPHSEDAVFIAENENVKPYADLVHAYLQDKESSIIVNANGLNNPENGLQVVYNGEQIIIYVCDMSLNLYKWIIEHRDPKRQYDPNYEKHSKTEKLVKKGKVASPITYTKDELNQMLEKAVCTGAGHGELYFFDKDKEKYVIFWGEGGHLYHAFEFTEENNAEIQKIWERGGRDLMKRIEMVAEMN